MLFTLSSLNSNLRHLSVWLALALTIVLVTIAHSGRPTHAVPLDEPQLNSMDKRGFRTSSLATARGFGKRNNVEVFPFESKAPAKNSGSNYVPAGWLANRLTNNPELARLVVSKFIDSDGDGWVSESELYD